MPVNTRKHRVKVDKAAKGRKPAAPAEATAPVEAQPQQPQKPSPDFERELQDHFAAEERRKVEEATENIFGSVLARHGWVRNERGQMEYVGGEGA